MEPQRYLDSIETGLKGSAPSYCIEYVGDLAIDALTKAYALLGRRHPLLRSRIRVTDRGDSLELSPGYEPDVETYDGDFETLAEVISGVWAPERSVARLVVVRGDTRGYIALRMDHAVTDGGIKMALFRQLLSLYGEIESGKEVVPREGTAFPAPPSVLLEKRWGTQGAWRAPDSRRAVGNRHVAVQRVTCLGVDETALLVRAARTLGTSVHGLLCGSILVAQRAHDSRSVEAPMVCLSPVDLRHRVDPPVDAMATTRFLGLHMTTPVVSPDSDPVVVGRNTLGKLERAISERRLLTAPEARPLPWVHTPLETPVAHASVSNYGVLVPFTGGSSIEIVDFLTLADGVTGPFPTYAVYTYGGRLAIRSVFPGTYYSQDDVDSLLKRVVTRLSHLGEAHGMRTSAR
ncbi:hypothetical protein ABZ639_06545 [Saccharomonospora sp. NPDC006951]